MKRVMALMAVCAVALAACGSGSKSQADAPLPVASSTTSTTLSYAVPATIDTAYLNRVMAAINHVRGDVRRDIVVTHTLSDADKAKLGDIYADKVLQSNLDTWSQSAVVVDPTLKARPGDEVESVQEVLKQQDNCVVFTTKSDPNALFNSSRPPTGPWVIALWTYPGDHGSNPTPWKAKLDVAQGDPGSDYRC